MPSNDSNRDLKVFAIIGLVGLILVVVLPAYLGYVVLLHWKSSPNVPITQGQQLAAFNEPLGELGSHCGGAEHLPCRPGLSCTNDSNMPNVLGTCQRAAATGTAEFIGQPTDHCTSGDSCAAGLFCKGLGSGSGVCTTLADGSVQVASVQLQGMQPSQGQYLAKVGTKVTVTVEAQQADSVKAAVVSFGGTKDVSKDLGTLTAGTDGTFTTNFTVEAGLSGTLVVTATAKNGDQASLALRIATIK